VRDLSRLSREAFDLLVVGGGIIGAGVARDGARRGLRVALVEQDDFAAGTTSRPTRLIHGGLRYLALFDFGLVRSDLREREILLRIAPHLVFPLPFLLPLYGRNVIYRARLRAGMELYDALSYDKSLPGRSWLSAQQAIQAEPGLNPEGLQGAWRFYDAQVPVVERLALENAVDAAAHGACIVNHARAVRFLRGGARVVGAEVEDQVGGTRHPVRASAIINATGPWLDGTMADLRDHRPSLLRLTKGVHVITATASRCAHVLFAQSDGRLFFVVPWLGQSMIGTTDRDYAGDPGAAAADSQEVRYLLREARRVFADAPLDVHYTMAGIRSLRRVEGVKEGDVSRKHTLVDHGRREGFSGVLSVIGGKLTAFRGIAEEAVDWACRHLGRPAASDTARAPLPGAGHEGLATLWPRAQALGLDRRQAEHLTHLYGARAAEVLRLAEHHAPLRSRLHPQHPDIAAQVVHAVQEEWALTLADFLLRRSALGLMPDQALPYAAPIARRMGELLGWDAAEQARQVEAYQEAVEPMRRFSGRAASDGTI